MNKEKFLFEYLLYLYIMNKIICSYCGTIEEIEKNVSEFIYFPNRLVYINPFGNPCKCKTCNNHNNMIIFGKQFINQIFTIENANLDNIHLSNIEYEKNKLIKLIEIKKIS